MPPSMTIIVPCYNEEERLDIGKFASFIKNNPQVKFLFVDDGSTDKTVEVLKALIATTPGFADVYSLPKNMGKAEAVRHGFVKAFEAAPEFVGFWDADLSTPLEAIPLLWGIFDERENVEIVIGARVQLLGRSIERNPARHYLGRIFSTVVSLVLGLRIYDSQCGAKLFKVSTKLEDIFREPFMAKWIFDVEIIARLMKVHRERNLPPVENVIYEYPLPRWRDVEGSKLSYMAFVVASRDLFRIYWATLKGR